MYVAVAIELRGKQASSRSTSLRAPCTHNLRVLPPVQTFGDSGKLQAKRAQGRLTATVGQCVKLAGCVSWIEANNKPAFFQFAHV